MGTPIETLAGADKTAFIAAMRSAGLSVPAVISLSTTQLLHLQSAPVTLIAAPGANKVIVIDGIFVQTKYGTVDISQQGGQNNIRYLDVNGTIVGTPIFDVSSSQIDQVGETTFSGAPALYANAALILCSAADSVNWGQLTTATVGAGGSGYAPGDTGYVDPDSGDAIYTVDTVDGGGAVLTFHFSDHGSGYHVSSGLSTSVATGGGDGAFTLNVTSITPGDGTAQIIITHHVITLI